MKSVIQLLAFVIVFCETVHAQVPVYLDETKTIDERVEDALSRMTIGEKINMIHAQSKFSTKGCPRLGIPELWFSDGPHGVRMEIQWDSWNHAQWSNDSCVAFPALTCLAATFNPVLSFEYGNALGEEARFRKKDVILGPGVNIYRTPLNGRNFEYMGEDPYLVSEMVVPYIQGVQKNGVSACLKHFALNNQEEKRKNINVEAGDRALREIYLPAFKAGVEKGKVWSIMGAYNKFRGQWATHHELLTNQILKEEWHFDGVVVSDWGSTHSTHDAALYGLDMEMGTRTDGLHYTEKMAYDKYYLATPYLEQIRKGQLPVSTLDDKVRRVLRLHFRTNMNRNRPYGSFRTQEHYDVARRVAEEGIVLLKNKSCFFPIIPGIYDKILVVGNNAVRSQTVGGGSSELKAAKEVSPLQGLLELYGREHVVFTEGYTTGASKWHPTQLPITKSDSLKQKALELAREADVILFFGGLNKNYRQDSESADRESYELPYGQNELISALVAVNPNIGVVLISGNAVAMPWIDDVPALMQSWYLGSEAGTATARVISGHTNPSGHLPFSIPRRLKDNAAHSFGSLSYPGDSINVVYKEDILVGYRWHDTKNVDPLFSFGHGLSYTKFKYGKLSADRKIYGRQDTIKVSVDVSNVGKRAGKEVVQLYVGQKNPRLLRPEKELKSFQKVELNAGETKRVELTVCVKDLAYFDDQSGKWQVDADCYELYCASSAAVVRSSVGIKVQ